MKKNSNVLMNIKEKFKTDDIHQHHGSFFYTMIILRYILCILIAIITVGPFLWLISMAIRTEGNIYDFCLIPKNPSLKSFVDTWNQFQLKQSFINSCIVALISVLSNILLASLAAYPLARLNFPGKNFIFIIIISTLMIPFQLYMIPLYLLCVDIKISGSFIGLILPFSVGAFGIFLIKQYYQTIPKDLEEAARVDGAGEFQIWWRIMFPLTKPAIGTLAIFIFVGSWSTFLWPLIILDENKYTLPVQIAKLAGVFVDKTNYLAAGSIIAIAPVIIMFLFLQRFFIGGITLGAVKG